MSGSSSHPSLLYERSDQLNPFEEPNQWISDILEFIGSFGDFQSDVIPDQEPAQILKAARLHLRRWIKFDTLAFLIVNESDFDFVLTDCEPESNRSRIQKELDFQIDKGVFAWAIHQSRAVTVKTKYFSQPLILHPLMTRLRVLGMFVGVLATNELNLVNISSNLLTLLLFNLAHALENAMLYRKLNEQNRNLEETVQRRTEALRKALEEADVAHIAKNQFLANVSHEIRTPLNAMIGFSELLMETPLNEEQTQYGKMIKESSETLLSLINDILDISKAEAGQLSLERIDFDPEEVAYDVCELMGPAVGKKPIEILCRIGKNLPSHVKGDKLRFRQVLINLMGNAAKFTHAGEIEISVTVEEEQDDRLKLHVMIRDTGIGVPKDKLTNIFEPFQQANGSMTRKYGGTGLGLPICKQIAKAMGGDVWAESELKKGSQFHFTASLERSEHQRDKRWNESAFHAKRILLVDDNPTRLEILRQEIESGGIRVTPLTRGEEAVSLLRKAIEAGDPFDLCLIDLQMPHRNGYEVAKEVQQSQIPNLYLVALSSSFERGGSKWEEQGFDAILTKPVRREKCFQLLEQCLGEMKKETDKEDDTQNQRRKLASEQKTVKQPPHILLAEDNLVNQKVATKMLEKLGCYVDVAVNGLDAVKKVKEGHYDLVFMDGQMPGMDGYEATAEIRKREDPSEHIPIIAMTAHAMKGDMERCLEGGMDDYLTKPIKKEMIFEMVKKWYRRKWL